MAGIGGSDGDGGGSRYQKELAAQKIREAKEKEARRHRTSSVSQVSTGITGKTAGCMVGSWAGLMSITVVLLCVLLFFRLLLMTGQNIASIDTIKQYSFAQYFRNIYHLDRPFEFQVESKALACFHDVESFVAGRQEPLLQLSPGDVFLYRGYELIGTGSDSTLVAIELPGDPVIHCYALLPEKWTGMSYWSNGESKRLSRVLQAEE